MARGMEPQNVLRIQPELLKLNRVEMITEELSGFHHSSPVMSPSLTLPGLTTAFNIAECRPPSLFQGEKKLAP